jgi:hypothetical protein
MNDQEETLALKVSEQLGVRAGLPHREGETGAPVPTCPISSVAVFLKTHKLSATELQPAQQLPRAAPKEPPILK